MTTYRVLTLSIEYLLYGANKQVVHTSDAIPAKNNLSTMELETMTRWLVNRRTITKNSHQIPEDQNLQPGGNYKRLYKEVGTTVMRTIRMPDDRKKLRNILLLPLNL